MTLPRFRAMPVLVTAVLLVSLSAEAQGLRTLVRNRGAQRSPIVLRLLPAAPALSEQCTGNALTGTRGEAVTFTRALAAGCIKSDNSLTLVASGSPRVDSLGYLSEPTVINRAPYSQELDNAQWVNIGTAMTRTADQAVAPDGTTTAEKFDLPAVSSGGFSDINIQNGSITGVHTLSGWVKGVTGSGTVYFHILAPGPTWFTGACAYTSTAWTRCSVTGTLTAGTNYAVFGVDRRASGTADQPAQSVYAWGFQWEAGYAPTSYFPTGNSTSTSRPPDLALVWNGFWPYSAGRVEMNYTPQVAAPAVARTLMDTGAGAASTSGVLWTINSSGALTLKTAAGATNTTLSSANLTWTVGQIYRLRADWSNDGAILYRDGVPVATAASGQQMPDSHMARTAIGAQRDGTLGANGHITDFRVSRNGGELLKLIATLGDSITIGNPYTLADPWPSKWQDLLSAGKRHHNFAVSGSTTTDLYNNQWVGNANQAKWYQVLILSGINDINNNATAATLESRLETLYSAIEASGAQVIHCSIMPYGNFAGWNTIRQAVIEEVNAWIQARATSHASPFVDLYTAMGDPLDGTKLNSAYDGGDGLHPNDAGAQAMADAVDAVVDP